MIVVEYRNIELDYCHSCKGVWFDSGELELLLRSQGLEESKAFFDGIFKSEEAVSSENRRACPICGRKMRKTKTGGQPEILVDVCRDQHGLWFDGGEIGQLMRHLAGRHPSKRDSQEQVIDFLEEVFKAPQQSASA
jgi:Zn-finger nucleic acid-binding protein